MLLLFTDVAAQITDLEENKSGTAGERQSKLKAREKPL